jgi:hypothetical protein
VTWDVEEYNPLCIGSDWTRDSAPSSVYHLKGHINWYLFQSHLPAEAPAKIGHAGRTACQPRAYLIDQHQPVFASN